MRILRVAQKVYPDVTGGGAYHVHAMSRDQATMGHDVTVLTVRHDPELPHVEDRDGYTVVRFDPATSPLGNEISPGVAQFLARAGDFDVVHAHSHLYFSTNLAALKRRLGGPPLAITNHGLFSQTAPEWMFEVYLRTLGRWTFNQADVIFCYTETDHERVREYGVTSQIEVVPNGIDTDRFTPNGPESDLINSDGPVVLFVGRLVEGKRPSLAIKAFAEVREGFSDAELYLCGEGPWREDLEELAVELGISETVTFLGQVPYEEMPRVYRSADVLVLPSRAEGVPRTVLEAMASDVSVVVSDLEQISEIVDDASQVVVYKEDEKLSEEVRKSINEKGCSECVITDHQWNDTVERTTFRLESLAG